MCWAQDGSLTAWVLVRGIFVAIAELCDVDAQRKTMNEDQYYSQAKVDNEAMVAARSKFDWKHIMTNRAMVLGQYTQPPDSTTVE